MFKNTLENVKLFLISSLSGKEKIPTGGGSDNKGAAELSTLFALHQKKHLK